MGNIISPSYKTGFAPRDGYPQYPSLWKNCKIACCPSLGVTGSVLINHGNAGKGNNGTIVLHTNTLSNTWKVDGGKRCIQFIEDNFNFVDLPATTATMMNWQSAPFSVSCWARRSADGGFDGFITLATSASNGWNLNFRDGTHAFCGWTHSGSYIVGNTTGVPNDFDWHHLGLSCDGTTVWLWIDGIKQANTGLAPTSVSAPNLEFGRFYVNGTHGLTGFMDDILIYNRKLLDNEWRLLARRRGIAYELESPYFVGMSVSQIAAIQARSPGRSFLSQFARY